jgi:mxaJ protein
MPMTAKITSRMHRAGLAGFALFALAASVPSSAARPLDPLRVCADPNNLPFSNEAGEGFEIGIAKLIGQNLRRQVTFFWWPQRRGFFRNTLGAGQCDVVLGVPAGFERALTTSPYYRSTYVFVSRTDRAITLRSFDDPRLRELVVGVQLIGDDGVNTPPAHALTSRGIVDNVRGYSVFGDYAQPNPTAAIVNAVVEGDVDVAIVWGPLAGYFARRSSVPLSLMPVQPAPQDLAMAFDIAVGVRKTDAALRDEIETVLVEQRGAVGALLDDYGVPRSR